MPQKTNLNLNPYYDDFDKENNYYRVLFKPGFPIQARELTTLQSILQDQIESFGSHMFKDGSMVIPGGITYISDYHSIKINTEHLGIPVILYADQLIGKKLTGSITGISVVVDSYLTPEDSSEITDLTLFVQYLNAGDDNTIKFLDDGEELITETAFTYGNTTLNEDDTVATLIATGACAIGCAAAVANGVYFIRGSFVNVSADKIVLDPYTNEPSYRVGLNISEEITTIKEDPNLYDNARGFSNFAAPGADRLKISTTLTKKPLTDIDDKNFVELLRLNGGLIKKLQNKSTYSIVKDYFAKRTFEESGNYAVDKFIVNVTESLNDRLSNEGTYLPGETTQNGLTPSDNLMSVKISPGRAYVKGFDIEKQTDTIVDVEKPRTTALVPRALIPFEFGTLLRLNNVFGTPFFGINNNSNKVKLYNQRRNSTTAGNGTEIGEARVYSFGLTDDIYRTGATSWDLFLFDLQTYITLTLNQALNSTQCPATSLVRGVSSGASGYVVTAAAGTTINLIQTSGTFIVGEALIINETQEFPRSVSSVTAYSTEDIKSVWQDSNPTFSGFQTDFGGDVILQRSNIPGFILSDKFQITTAGAMTCPGKTFGLVKVGSIIRYQIAGVATETFNRVSSISADLKTITLVAVTDVTDVCSGALPGSTVSGVTATLGVPTILNKENQGLYAKLSNKNVGSVNLSSSNIQLRRQITGQSTNASGTLTLTTSSVGITSAFFQSFDADRYSVHYSDGAIEDLSGDQFTISGDGTQLTVNGLRTSQSNNVTINVTLVKNSMLAKQKSYIRSGQLIVNNSQTGISTDNNGLTKNSFYGLRVEDKEISLNRPDVVKVTKVFESLNNIKPVFDKLTFISGLNLTISAIVGERIIGSSSGAVAQIVEIPSSSEVNIVYLTTEKFVIGETSTFEESGIITNLQNITQGSYLDVTNNFTLDKGQKDQYYDYSKIVRKTDSIPSRQLLVVFDYYQVPSGDSGDVFVVSSYPAERFTKDVPYLPDGTRATDTLDFRPMVSVNTSTTQSPFAFASRNFATSGTNSAIIVAPGESSLISYNYYLGRKDLLVLNSLGQFSVVQGVPALDPKLPTNVEGAMDIATIELPPYLYNTSDASIILVDNRRYTMRDIGKLEDRIKNLEITTSLSLLELNTKSLQIQDADGLSRFKTGFFVDDFKDNSFIELSDPDAEAVIDTVNQELVPAIQNFSITPELALATGTDYSTADFNADLNLLESTVKKTGDIITLNYTEVGWIEQPLASRVENVNPFNMIEFNGGITLHPPTDNWVRDVFVDGGTRTITGSYDGTYIETIKTSSYPDTHLRSRNVGFAAGGLKPLTRYYPFFDGSSGVDIVPKLIEISMISGVFSSGEVVKGYLGSDTIVTFRLAAPNHKLGDINNPNSWQTVFTLNPYNKSLTLPSNYTSSSTVLNVDIRSLVQEVQGRFFGRIARDCILVGESSGAQARVTDIRLITDTWGDVGGALFFRNPLTTPPPSVRFQVGTRAFKLTSSSSNSQNVTGSLLISAAETTYSASGVVDVYTQPPPPPPPRRGGKDPLAQSFTVDETGAFLTSVDLFFASKDDSEKVFVELRTVELGTPTNTMVQDFCRVPLEPTQVNVSSNAEVATNVKFQSPIYLEPNREYAIVVLAPTSNNYECWIARMGEKTVNTQSLPNAESVLVTKQYIGGSLFKSQNGTIWTANQFEDMKFKLYKANFVNKTGTVYFYNPTISDTTYITPDLNLNPIKTLPRKLRVGITSVLSSQANYATMQGILNTGRKVSEGNAPGPIGYIEQVGGSVSGLTLTGVGTGFANGTYSNVNFYNINGNGSGATGVVTVANNVVSAVSINVGAGQSGNGYVVGDVLGITTSTLTTPKGGKATITVAGLSNIDTLYLSNVAGEEFTSGSALVYFDNNVRTSMANTTIRSSSVLSDLYTGTTFEVSHPNHGMTQDSNKVSISNITPNTTPITLTAVITLNSTTVSLASTAGFATFEGQSSSTGYIKVNNEVIFYNSVNANNTLGIGTRGTNGTQARDHSVGDIAYKYELNGVSLHRLNKSHNMVSNATLTSLKDTDKYYLQFTRADRGSGDTQLSFNDQKSLGGSSVRASQNLQFNTILPQLNVITPGEGTRVKSEIRTVSGTSAGGVETSFEDQGYESLELNQPNSFNTPRLVCSSINEAARLAALPRNKSLTLAVTLSSNDKNLSPVLDLENTTLILQRTRINNPIKNYVSDGRSNQLTNDPHTAAYISKKISLKQPASSLKVLIGAYRPSTADFRVLYRLFRPDSSEITQSYELFPGYDNLRDSDGDGFGDTIIDPSLNSGRADAFVAANPVGQYSEYQFSINDVDPFTGFIIKIVMSSTDEANPPKFKDLRAIALA
jgi:hypothetical protein